jgi:hypothetical protein
VPWIYGRVKDEGSIRSGKITSPLIPATAVQKDVVWYEPNPAFMSKSLGRPVSDNVVSGPFPLTVDDYGLLTESPSRRTNIKQSQPYSWCVRLTHL